MALHLNDPITKVPLIGPTYAQKLQKLDIFTVADLLHHYPIRYFDRSQATKIIDLEPDENFTINAQVIDFKNIYTRSGKNLQKALVADDTDKLEITWFNQKYLENAIEVGETYAFSGKPKIFRNQLSFTSPEFEKLNPYKPQLHTGRLVPKYSETAGVSSKWLRSRIKLALKHTTITDHLPSLITKNYKLKTLVFALSHIHFPPDKESLEAAKYRLAFDEIFVLQLNGAFKRRLRSLETTTATINPDSKKIKLFIQSLPFKLTPDQTLSIKEILADLKKPSPPMNRLLEGDVGSGKTVVAATAIYATKLSGFQSIFMAPTEILATQHFQELKRLFKNTKVTIGLKTSSTKTKGKFDVLVGTHALLFHSKSQVPNPESPQVGLVITDEQHRFGVKQRAQLEKIGNNPHRLTMSATPIPRTVALTLYGDLDVSIIKTMPQNRKPVKTWLVPNSKRINGYKWIREQIHHHQSQAFVVCPLIDDSQIQKLDHIKSAIQIHQELSKLLPDLKISLLHGKLKSKQKDEIINDFKDQKTHILVSTVVIEVGIDIPNATIMVVESAERFGLAQLHQLRGRVGRGDQQSYCLLFPSHQNIKETSRLKALTKHKSGFQLAKIDLKLRGPGEVFGLDQHGFSDLKLARLTDKKLLASTRKSAKDLVSIDPNLQKHPQLREFVDLSTHHITTLN